MLLAKKNFKFHAPVQKCHFGKNEKLSDKSKIYTGKSAKRGFSKKALTGIEKLFLF